MTATRQSIVTWHPWPENDVEGLPEAWIMILVGPLTHPCVCLQFAKRESGGGMVWASGKKVPETALEEAIHYALASDLEKIHEIDGDKCGILPRAIIDRARATVKQDLKVQNEDRVRWLVEQAVVISASQPDMSCLNAIEYVIGLASEARAQVELERKEANHE